MERATFFGGSFSGVIPALCCFLFVLIANLPMSLLGGRLPPPLLTLMPVYFWTLIRPDLMPPALALAAGVAEDLFSGGPPGIWGLAFVAAYALADRQRESLAGLSGVGAVLGFALVTCISVLTAYLTIDIYYWQLVPVSPFLLEIGVTVIYYIPVAFLLGFIHRRFVGAQRSEI